MKQTQTKNKTKIKNNKIINKINYQTTQSKISNINKINNNIRTNNKSTRSYKCGIKFTNSEDALLAFHRVKQLQQQSLKRLDEETIALALDFFENHPEYLKEKGTFAGERLAKYLSDRSNLHKSTFLYLTGAIKERLQKIEKVVYFLEMLKQDPLTAVEWFIFARTPYLEKHLMYKYQINYEYARNLVLSARRNHSARAAIRLHRLETPIPKFSATQIENFCKQLYEIKSQSNIDSENFRVFLTKIQDLQDSRVYELISQWFYATDTKRWATLKEVAKQISRLLDSRKNYFSAVRAVVVLTLSSILQGTVNTYLSTLQPKDCISLPFVNSSSIPLSLVMGSRYVIEREGNYEILTEQARSTGEISLRFVKANGLKSVTGRIFVHQKLREYLSKGAEIKSITLWTSSKVAKKIRVSVVMEGNSNCFGSYKNINSYKQVIAAKQHCKDTKLNTFDNKKIIGLDINRVGHHMLTVDSDISLPGDILLLCRKYKQLSSVLESLSSKTQRAYNCYQNMRYTKFKTERKNVYERQNRLHNEIQRKCSQFLAALLIYENADVLAIEAMTGITRGTKGALAKAIISLPLDDQIYINAVELASSQLDHEVQIVKIQPSKYVHHKCGGHLQRDLKHWDFAPCDRCNEVINTHLNAAYSIKELAAQQLSQTIMQVT